MSEKLQKAIDKFSFLIEAQLDIYNSENVIPIDEKALIPIEGQKRFPWTNIRIGMEENFWLPKIMETETKIFCCMNFTNMCSTAIRDTTIKVLEGNHVIITSGELKIGSPNAFEEDLLCTLVGCMRQYHELYYKGDDLYGKYASEIVLNFDVDMKDIEKSNVWDINNRPSFHGDDRVTTARILIEIPKPSDKGLIHDRPILVV